MSSPSQFGGELDVKLIELVKENSFLYNPSHTNYSDIELRDNTWQKIGEALRKPARRCKLRWANIRDMMRKKIKDRHRNPEDIIKRYRYEKQMSFMIPFFKEGSTSNDLLSDILEDNKEVEMPAEVYVNDTANSENDDAEDVKPILTFRKRKRESSDNCDYQSSTFCQELNTSDPVDVFLMTIGSTLRKLGPVYLNQAKSKIFQTVQNYELEQIVKDNPTQTVVSSGSSR